MVEIRARIKQGLQMRNMKQAELADKTGIDKGQISSYLSGKYKPKQENLSLLAAALDVSEYWLGGLDVSMEREGSGDTVEQKRRFEAYAKQMYAGKEPEKVLVKETELEKAIQLVKTLEKELAMVTELVMEMVMDQATLQPIY